MVLIQTIGRNRAFTVRRRRDHAGLDEQSVVTLAVIGDREAFEELVRRRQSWLRVLLRRLCGDSSLADDLAQQVFLQSWRSIGTLRSSQAFPAWIKRMAVNAWLQHLRTKQPLDSAEGASETRCQPAVPDATGTGIDVDRALATLPAEVRLCIVLAYNEGMSHREIADVTAMPLGTVKSHIKRGCSRLQRFLAAYGGAEGENMQSAS